MVCIAIYFFIAILLATLLAGAKTILSCYDKIPDDLCKLLIDQRRVEAKTWDQLFKDQDAPFPIGNGERWQADNLYSVPQVPRDELIKAIKPIMCGLPTRRSTSMLLISDFYPDEAACAISLQQPYCISSVVCWTDPACEPRIREWTRSTFDQASIVGSGQYLADFDITHRSAKVMSDSALEKWLKIRGRWDPEGVFPGYKGYAAYLNRRGTSSENL